MFIQVNTANQLKRSANLSSQVADTLEAELERFEDCLTSVEVHLGDENADKGGAHDKRCMIEARLKGVKPIAVTECDSTVEDAIVGATEKIKHALEHEIGKLSQRH